MGLFEMDIFRSYLYLPEQNVMGFSFFQINFNYSFHSLHIFEGTLNDSIKS